MARKVSSKRSPAGKRAAKKSAAKKSARAKPAATKSAATTSADAGRALAPSAGFAADAGKRTAVIARLETGEDIKQALITTDDQPFGVRFGGDDPRNQEAAIGTDEHGTLTWGLDAELKFVGGWKLTLTKKGAAPGGPDAQGGSDPQGRITTGDIKQF